MTRFRRRGEGAPKRGGGEHARLRVPRVRRYDWAFLMIMAALLAAIIHQVGTGLNLL